MISRTRKRLAVAGAFVIFVASGASAQAQAPRDRWSLEIGEARAPAGPSNRELYVSASARIGATGPLEWRAAAAAYGLVTLRRVDLVTVQMYCPDAPSGCGGYDVYSSLKTPIAAGLTMRVVNWPHWLSRTIVEIGTGAYYAEWKRLPPYDTSGRTVFTGYRLATLGVRITRHVGAVVGATQFRNLQYRDDETSWRIGVQVSW